MKRNQAELIVFMVGVLIALPAQCYRARQHIGPHPLDISWVVELPARLGHGEIAGGDFIYTHGPLFQLLHAPGLLVGHGELASLMRWHSVLEIVLVMLGAWWTLRCTGAPRACAGLGYLLWAVLIGTADEVDGAYLKPMGGLFAAAAAARACFGGVPRNDGVHRVRAGFALIWALPVPVSVLYAFDLGVITLAALLLIALLLAAATYGITSAPSKLLRRGALEGACIAVAATALLAVIMGLLPVTRRYLPESWAFSAGYAVLWAFPGATVFYTAIAAAVVMNLVALLVIVHRVRACLPTAVPDRPSLLALGSLMFALIWLRYPLTRTDGSHVFDGLLPTAFVLGLMLPAMIWQGGFARVGAVLSGVVMVPMIWFAAQLHGSWDHVPTFRHLELRGAYVECEDPTLRAAADEIRLSPATNAYVWPYETMATLMAGKTNVAYTLQSHTALDARFQQKTVDQIAASPGLPVVLFTKSLDIDGVANLTRSSRIFRYLLENYELGERQAGFSVLQRAATPRPFNERALLSQSQSFTPAAGRSFTLDLAASDCRSSDLLMLRIRVARTRLFGVAKPGWLIAGFFFSNGESHGQVLPVPPDGKSHDLLVAPRDFAHLDLTERFQRSPAPRSETRVVALRLQWQPLDILSRRPARIDLEGLAVLEPEDRTVESGQ